MKIVVIGGRRLIEKKVVMNLRQREAGSGKLIKASPIHYTIVRATQFFEFVGAIARLATEGQTVRLPPVLMQPIAADDVAAVMADVALAEPLNWPVPSRSVGTISCGSS